MLDGMMMIAALVPQAGATPMEIVTEPAVEIGASATDPDDQLYDVGPVLRTAAGGFLIVETVAGRIRAYDAQGDFVRDLGGQGDGPGEFREILDASLAGDTLLVLDRNGSVTRLRLDGSVIDTRRTDYAGLTDERFNPVPHGVLADGRVLIRAQERVFGRPDGDYVREVAWFTVDAGGRVDTLGVIAGQAVRSEDGIPRPFRPWIDPAFAAAAGDLWLSVPADGRLVRPSDGAEIRPPAATRSPTPDDLERFREAYVGRGGSANDRRVIAEWVDEAPVAERLPPFRRFIVDALGRVWVERWPTSPDRTTWDVHDRRANRSATVTIPLDLRLEAASEDGITGVWTDPFGVERVREYRLPHRIPRNEDGDGTPLPNE